MEKRIFFDQLNIQKEVVREANVLRVNEVDDRTVIILRENIVMVGIFRLPNSLLLITENTKNIFDLNFKSILVGFNSLVKKREHNLNVQKVVLGGNKI